MTNVFTKYLSHIVRGIPQISRHYANTFGF